jgi:hypothetical protein
MERAWVRPDIVSQAGIIPITVAGIDAHCKRICDIHKSAPLRKG